MKKFGSGINIQDPKHRAYLRKDMEKNYARTVSRSADMCREWYGKLRYGQHHTSSNSACGQNWQLNIFIL